MSGELDDVREVVLVPAVVLATVRLKQVITWKKVRKLIKVGLMSILES